MFPLCINDVFLIPLELIRSNCDAVRKGLIHKGNTLSPLGISRSDEAH